RGVQEEDAEPGERAAAYGGVPGCPQAGRVGGGGSIFVLPSGPRGAGRRGSAVQAFSPEAKTLAQGQFICPEHVKSERGPREVGDFAGRAGRRCGAWGACSCPRRRSWLSSS